MHCLTPLRPTHENNESSEHVHTATPNETTWNSRLVLGRWLEVSAKIFMEVLGLCLGYFVRFLGPFRECVWAVCRSSLEAKENTYKTD